MALLADVSRVWSNCRTYNHPAHPVNAACDTVEKYFRDTWSKNGLAQYGRPTVLGPYYDPHAPDDEDFGEGAAEREEGAGGGGRAVAGAREEDRDDDGGEEDEEDDGGEQNALARAQRACAYVLQRLASLCLQLADACVRAHHRHVSRLCVARRRRRRRRR